MITQFSKKGGSGFFFQRLLKRAVLDQPTVDSGGVSRGRSVAVAVGCLHFNGTSTALPRHFHGTSTVLLRHFQGQKKLYLCFYPHRLRDSTSLVWAIFLTNLNKKFL